MASTTNETSNSNFPIGIKKIILTRSEEISEFIVENSIVSGVKVEEIADALSYAIFSNFGGSFSLSDDTSFDFYVSKEFLKEVFKSNGYSFDIELLDKIEKPFVIEIAMPINAKNVFSIIENLGYKKPDEEKEIIARSILSLTTDVFYHFKNVKPEVLTRIAEELCKACCSLSFITSLSCSRRNIIFEIALAKTLYQFNLIDKPVLGKDYPTGTYFC